MRWKGEDVASQIKLRGGDGDSVIAALQQELTRHFGHTIKVDRKRRSDGPKKGNAASHFGTAQNQDKTYHIYWTQQYKDDWRANLPMRIRWEDEGRHNTAYQKMVVGDRGDLYATIWFEDKISSRVVAINVVDLVALRKLREELGANGRMVSGCPVDRIIRDIISVPGAKFAEIDVQRLQKRYGVKLCLVASHRVSLGLLDLI